MWRKKVGLNEKVPCNIMAKRTIVGRTQFLLFFIFLTSPSPGVAVGRTGRRSCFCTPRTWNIFNSSSSIVIITITRPLEFLNWLGKRNCFFLERQHCQLSSNYIHNCLNLNWAELLTFFYNAHNFWMASPTDRGQTQLICNINNDNFWHNYIPPLSVWVIPHIASIFQSLCIFMRIAQRLNISILVKPTIVQNNETYRFFTLLDFHPTQKVVFRVQDVALVLCKFPM